MSDPEALSPNLPPLREVIRAHGLRAEKSLGQNFLLDQNLTDKIVRKSGPFEGVNVIEIGPGPGGLTRSLLLSTAKKVTAVEFDPRAVKALQELEHVYPIRLEVVQADALKTNLLAITPAPRAIVANLPYNISTVLLLQWLRLIHENHNHISFMTLMFQKEVADRIVALPGNKAYGRLSVMANWLCTPKKLFDLPPSAFTPPPKIKSTIVHFVPRLDLENKPGFATMEKILAAAFQQRRKMIRTSLAEYAGELELTGIDTSLRAEDVSIEDYLRLAQTSEKKAC